VIKSKIQQAFKTLCKLTLFFLIIQTYFLQTTIFDAKVTSKFLKKTAQLLQPLQLQNIFGYIWNPLRE